MAKTLATGRKPQTFKTPRYRQSLIKDVRPIVECLGCGNKFESHYYWSPNSVLKMYCSPSCSSRMAKPRKRLVESPHRNKGNTARLSISASAILATITHPRVCVSCGYSGASLDVCHLIPVKSFGDDQPISVINDKNNLRIMCKNCHWEYDHNKETGMVAYA